MLPLDKCRKLIQKNPEISDNELEEIRERLYQLADIIIDAYRQNIFSDKDRTKHSPYNITHCSKIQSEKPLKTMN